MSLLDAWQLLKRKWLVLTLVPLLLSLSAYYFGRNLPKTYGSNTTIYTGIASGYSLKGDATVDYNTTSNAFDNLVTLITARSTKQEVSYRLLAQHLWETAQNPTLLDAPPYESLRDNLPPALRQRLTGATPDATLTNVRQYGEATSSNELFRLFSSSDPTYSLAALSHLSASRIATSDAIRLDFDSYNPQLCQTTLTLATQVFLAESRNLREEQTSPVIKYYESELVKAKARLARAESVNVAFNREHNIINYEEQASNIASEKETLAEELTQVSQQYAGATAALQAINRRLGGRQAALSSSNAMLQQRQKLSRLNASIADQQVFGAQSETNAPLKVKQLQQEADRLTQEMQGSVDKYYAHTNSVEGIPTKQLLAEWVQNMTLVESNRAKLAVMNRRRQQFEQEYARMAPLGAILKRNEREIELAEKSYLALLASLNTSKAAQQNTQLASLKIIDPPNLPLTPKSNKLVLLVLASGAGSFIFALSLVLGLGLLDRSLKKPSVAAQQTGLPVAGLMLDKHAAPTKLLQASHQRSLQQLVRRILLSTHTAPSQDGPFVVGILSVQRQEGKTTLCQALAERCHAMGMHTLALYPDGDALAAQTDSAAPALFYPAELAAVQGWQLDQLIQHAEPKRVAEAGVPSPRVVLVEFPALREEELPVGLLRQLHLIFLTVPATRAWRRTDHQAVETLRATTGAPVEVVLSGVALHHSEEAYA